MALPDMTASVAGGGGSPAGYGRSCGNCSRSKTKCILRPSGGSCERCFRLKKECQPMETTRKRTIKKASGGSSSTSSSARRTAQLEEKIDDLVSILRASQQTASPHSQSSGPQSHAQKLLDDPRLQEQQQNGGFASRLDSLATAATSSSHNHSRHPHSQFPRPPGCPNVGPMSPPVQPVGPDRPLEPTPEEAEQYLIKFRTWLRGFPFVHIPPRQTAAELREQRPFFWKCIMGITSMSVVQLHMLKEDIRKEVADRVVFGNERSMDVLLGLVCYMAWATFNAGPGRKPFLVIYAQMAASIIYDFGLTRSPSEEQHFNACFKTWPGRPHPPAKDHTTEERRIVLGLWFIMSTTSCFMSRADTIRFTPHMMENLDVLAETKEYPGDEVLVALVRTQLVGEEVQKLMLREVMQDPKETPSHVYRKSLETQLQSVRDTLTSNVDSHFLLHAHLLKVEATVQSIGLFTPGLSDAKRSESTYACLTAIRAFYQKFFDLPLLDVPGLPFVFYVDLSQVQVTLYRVTILDDGAFDKDLLRNTAYVLPLFDQAVDKIQAVPSVYPMEADDDETIFFVKGAKFMRSVKTAWEPAVLQRLEPGLPTPNSQMVNTTPNSGPGRHHELLNEPTGPGAAGGPGGVGPNGVADMPELQLDFGDLSWMTDILGPWEF